ncbi:C4b-binding protein beta chain isoform X2 [Nannospalax galili]|uniref:C4b-binding protein beta chain isoform X2 n=1 Tax=Nannospalax galili TaxID=1026970 RepID=UPI00111C2BB7|nr:C4b-binding protein beta chain isoform X2 [Nannospalax galili]
MKSGVWAGLNSSLDQVIAHHMLCWILCCFMWLTSASDESCPEPPPVDNSVFVAKEVEGQILGTYICIKGYHLIGQKALVCNASKEWDTSFTECRLGHCPDPVLANGKFNSSGPVNVSDKIMFKCNDHYILKGSNWSQCLEDHTWAPPFPVCQSRDCEHPGIPVHGYFEGETFTSGSIITYYCRERYRLVGTQELRCIDGEWSSSHPICELIQEAPKPVTLTEFEKAFLVFQENKDLCSAIESFMKRLEESGLTLEELKYSLEVKKAKLEASVVEGS